MTFKTQMTTDQSVFFSKNEFAISATVTTSLSSFSATITMDLGQVNGLGDLNGQTTLAFAIARKSEYPTPQRYDTILADGTTWRIEDVTGGDDISWSLQISTDRRVS